MRAGLSVVSLIAVLGAFSSAGAVPPVVPPDVKVVQAFMEATRRNDLPAYAALFSENAEIVNADGKALAKTAWLTSSAGDFLPARKTRFLGVIGGAIVLSDKLSTRFVITEEELHCRPALSMECFPAYRVETLTLTAGKIVRLERSANFTHALTADGAW